ncbi:ABC transporter substrate-binding protein [Streptomyces sp. NPDC050504]|uniref:ABC transporter substrate-binding protein n=1 Tax=Streptomyces sp. NPDC050504 TaxID=3365618 RepID=UPI003794C3FB
MTVTGTVTGRRHRHRATALAAAATATTVLALIGTGGCGTVSSLTGDGGRAPITVMTWAPQNTTTVHKAGMPAMAKAYARWINDRGGIDGHELRVITCDEPDDAMNTAESCARKAVKKGVAAVVGSYSRDAHSFMGPLESAGIPYIGGYGVADSEFSSYLSYPVNGGQPALIAGSGRQLAGACEKISMVRPDSAEGDFYPLILASGLAEGGSPKADVTDVKAPESAAEYEESARRALAGKGCVSAVLGDRTETFFDSFRRLREAEPKEREIRISSVLGSVGQPLIDRTGGKDSPLEGASVTGWYPDSGDPRWAPMREVIRKYAFSDNRIDAADTGVQTTWIAYSVLKAAVEGADSDEVGARQISRVLDRGAQVTTGGLTPTLRWDFHAMLPSTEYPRLVNRQVVPQVVRNGQLIAERKGGGFMDVTKALTDATP